MGMERLPAQQPPPHFAARRGVSLGGLDRRRRMGEGDVSEVWRGGDRPRSLNVGDVMPAFTLPNATGRTVSSADLLAKSPLVVSFYRGGW
jgi:hypothetical protein